MTATGTNGLTRATGALATRIGTQSSGAGCLRLLCNPNCRADEYEFSMEANNTPLFIRVDR